MFNRPGIMIMNNYYYYDDGDGQPKTRFIDIHRLFCYVYYHMKKKKEKNESKNIFF